MLMCAYHLMGNLMMGSVRHSQLCNHCKIRYCAQQHFLRQLWPYCIGILEDEQLNKDAQRCEKAVTCYILVESMRGFFQVHGTSWGVDGIPGGNRVHNAVRGLIHSRYLSQPAVAGFPPTIQFVKENRKRTTFRRKKDIKHSFQNINYVAKYQI